MPPLRPYQFQLVIGGKPTDLDEGTMDAFLLILPDSPVLQQLNTSGNVVLMAPSDELETFREEVNRVDKRSLSDRQLHSGRTLFAHLIHLRSIVGLVAVPGVTDPSNS
jgi:hypothetical protein